MKKYEFIATIYEASQKGGAYVVFPYDIRQEFNKGRVKVDVLFEDIAYRGSIVNMGMKDAEGQICYVIGMLKSIRNTLQKDIGDQVKVTVTEVKEENSISKDKKAQKLFDMSFSQIYPLYIEKVERKGRKKEEVDEAIFWLTGYDDLSLSEALEKNWSLRKFFGNAPQMNENAKLIKGSICGVKIQEIEDPLMKQIRYLDKLVDEIAKQKPMEKILRKS